MARPSTIPAERPTASSPVVWIVNHFAIPPDESGGTRHYSLARELMRRGMAPVVIAAADNYQTGQPRPLPEGAPASLQTCGGVPFLWVRAPARKGGSSLRRLWAMLHFSLQLLRGVPGRYLDKPDIVIGSSPHLFAAFAACLMAKRYGVPFILEIRDLWPDSLIEIAGYPTYHPMVAVLRLMEHWLYRHADHIVTVLADAAPYFIAHGGHEGGVTIIPNGVDLTLADAGGATDATKKDHKEFTVLYAGAHGIPNYLDTIIETAGILQKHHGDTPVRFLMVGDGICKAALAKAAAAHDLHNMVFRSPVPKKDIANLFAEADACYLQFRDASIYRWGVSPNKLFDYLVAGKPVLYAAAENVRINPVRAADAGYVLPPGDARAFADAILALVAMPEPAREAMGKRGREYAIANHSTEVFGERLQKTIESCLQARKAA